MTKTLKKNYNKKKIIIIVSGATLKYRISHVGKIYCPRSFPLDMAHVKCEVLAKLINK